MEQQACEKFERHTAKIALAWLWLHYTTNTIASFSLSLWILEFEWWRRKTRETCTSVESRATGQYACLVMFFYGIKYSLICLSLPFWPKKCLWLWKISRPQMPNISFILHVNFFCEARPGGVVHVVLWIMAFKSLAGFRVWVYKENIKARQSL